MLISLVLILSCLPSALIDYALPKWESDPNVRIEDAYKWLYQATRGGEHMVPDRVAAAEWLEKEWQTVGPALKKERIWEPLCPNGKIGRLNIRPFKERGGRAGDLIDAFIASSQAYRSEPESFLAVWEQLGTLLKTRRGKRLNYSEWLLLDVKMKTKNYPAIHHSTEYAASRLPAYRILTAEEAAPLIRATR